MQHDAPESVYRAPYDGNFDLLDYPTSPPMNMPNWEKVQKRLHHAVHRIAQLQKLLFSSPKSMLLVFQAMDAAGKDSTIRATLSGVNPQGVRVYGFRQPSSEELSHDFLWRVSSRAPEKGMINVFNRSHYEEVLVVRVHPEYLKNANLAHHVDAAEQPPVSPHALWEERFEMIRQYEQHLARSGTIILKFMLNVSKGVQAQRLLDRIDTADKNWKFSPTDLQEREHWGNYQRAYTDAIAATSRPWAPWYVMPADHKGFMREQVAEIVYHALRNAGLTTPVVPPQVRERLSVAQKVLLAELTEEEREQRAERLRTTEEHRAKRKQQRRAQRMRLKAQATLEVAEAEAGTPVGELQPAEAAAPPPRGVEGVIAHTPNVTPMDTTDPSPVDDDSSVSSTGTWNTISSGSSDSESSSSSDNDDPRLVGWGDLSSKQRAAAQHLGFDARKWDSEQDAPELVGKVWSRLTEQQQNAARVLGYSKKSWDADFE